MEIRHVENLEDALCTLFDGSFREDICRYRSNFVFRGVPNKQYKLDTGLARLGGHFADLEGPLLRNFRKYRDREPGSTSLLHWETVSLAQHHGLPTRLLDWTWSPLVALHFATTPTGMMDKDGRVWCIDLNQVFNQLPRKIQKELRKEYAFVPTVEMLDRFIPSFDAMSVLKDPEPEYLMFFEPPCIDARITNQFALFSVMPDAKMTVDNWLSRHPGYWRAVDITAASKWEIRDKLDGMNITERVIFPGLDGLADWLRRHYSPGP